MPASCFSLQYIVHLPKLYPALLLQFRPPPPWDGVLAGKTLHFTGLRCTQYKQPECEFFAQPLAACGAKISESLHKCNILVVHGVGGGRFSAPSYEKLCYALRRGLTIVPLYVLAIFLNEKPEGLFPASYDISEFF